MLKLDVFNSEGLGIRIFYQELLYKKEVEEPVYTTEKLLCDVGGAAGLFLGCRLDFSIVVVCYGRSNGSRGG